MKKHQQRSDRTPRRAEGEHPDRWTQAAGPEQPGADSSLLPPGNAAPTPSHPAEKPAKTSAT